MTVHERMEALADLLVAGGLGADERSEAERHAAECPACAALVRDAREFAAWAKGLIRKDAPPADLEDRVIGRFRAAGQVKKRRFIVGKRVLKLTGSIAAAVGLIVLGNLFSVQAGFSGDKVRTLDAEGADFRAIDGLPSGLGGQGKDSSAVALAGEYLRERSIGTDLPALETKHAVLARDRKHLEESLAKGGEDTKARAIREAYKDQLGRNEVTIGESQKVVDEFRRQTGWDFALNQRGTSYDDSKPADKNAKQPHFASKGDSDKTRTGAVFALTETERLLAKPTPVSPEPPPVKDPTPVQDNRKIIRNADVSLEVDSYDATYTKLADLAAAEKGFIASANTQKLANGKIQATVVVRIPPERFEAVITRFKEFGTVRHQNIGSEDVTKAYIDLQSRLASKQTLATRLSKLLAEGKGNVKELMEVEVQLGATNEAIEKIVGEIKFYDNRIGLSTITLQIAEKDLGQPFEYIQTLQANLALTVRDPDDAYAKAQKEITDAGGQVVDSRMNRQSDGTSTGTIRARVDADKFQALRDALKKLGVPTNDTVNQQKTAQGGREGTPKADAPLRKEQAVLDLTVSSPPLFVTRRLQLVVETPDVEGAYAASRKSVEGSGGKVFDGSLMGKADRMVAVLKIQADADKFGALTESLKSAGKVKTATVSSVLPAAASDGGAALLRERAEIEFTLVSPPQLIAEENGLGKSIRDTLANSWSGLLWSIEKLFVGLSLAGPWVAILAAGVFAWKKVRRKKAAV